MKSMGHFDVKYKVYKNFKNKIDNCGLRLSWVTGLFKVIFLNHIAIYRSNVSPIVFTRIRKAL